MFFNVNPKGQSSFELLLIIVVIIVLASFILLNAMQDLNGISAYAFLHNGYNNYKISENFEGHINYIDDSETIGFDTFVGKVFVSEEPKNSEYYVNNIKTNINNNTIYDNADVIFEG